MTRLLDANVLIALINTSHVDHQRVRLWFAEAGTDFATCPITQGALVRHYFRDTANPSGEGARALVSAVLHIPRHKFWPDDIGFDRIRFTGVIGHRQVTDAYLAALARRHGGEVATLDKALAALHADVAKLIPG